jgi:anti-sigma factor RsiW
LIRFELREAMMNCQTVKSLLSEFLDERLAAAEAWQVQTHLSDCAACGKTCRELESLRRALQALPTRQPSANFDSALAQRLALTRRPAPRRTWRDRLALPFRRPVPLLRPAFALGVAVAAVGGVLLLPTHAPMPEPTVASAVHSADHAFVADCVAQRRRDAAGEPLADLAAQNLADHLDNAASGDQPPTPAAASEVF